MAVKWRWGSERTFEELATINLARRDLKSDDMALRDKVSIDMYVVYGGEVVAGIMSETD